MPSGYPLRGRIRRILPREHPCAPEGPGGFASDAGGYLATIYRHPINIVAISAFVIATGAGAVAREIERGSILLVLACPVSRWRFATAKLLAMVAGLFVILAAMVAGTWIGVLVTGLGGEVEMAIFLRIQLNTFALAMAIGGYALLLSALGSDGGRTIAQATGITVVMFFLDFLAALWSPASALGPLSVFHYFDPLGVAQNGEFPARDLLVLFGVAGVTIAAALIGFQRRDIAR